MLVPSRGIVPGLVLGENDLSPREVVLVVQREKAVAIRGIALAITGGALAGVVHVELRLLQRQADEHLLSVLVLGKAALLLEKAPLAGSELDHRGSAAPGGRVAWQSVLPRLVQSRELPLHPKPVYRLNRLDFAGASREDMIGMRPDGTNNRAGRKQCGRDERPY